LYFTDAPLSVSGKTVLAGRLLKGWSTAATPGELRQKKVTLGKKA
jgi:hypothetical protein